MAFYVKVNDEIIAVASKKEDAIAIYDATKSDKDVSGEVTIQEITNGKEESQDSEGTQ